MFEDLSKLYETQKIYISGFPLGRALGKEITISPSAISSLRKDTTGMLSEIQVNGGMSPGNSGGPVISPAGNLVGVAVAVVRGTQINLAIPGDHVKRLMDGRVGDTTVGDAYLENGQTKLPVKVATIDPLNRIKQMRVEVWTGPAGQPLPVRRPAAATAARRQPAAAATGGLCCRHGGRECHGAGLIPPGQVYWIQPVVVGADGKTQWGVAVSSSATIASPLERKPADLTVNLTAQKERTVNIKTSASITAPQDQAGFIALKVRSGHVRSDASRSEGVEDQDRARTTSRLYRHDGDKKFIAPQARYRASGSPRVRRRSYQSDT